jgi:hypothetical protein
LRPNENRSRGNVHFCPFGQHSDASKAGSFWEGEPKVEELLRNPSDVVEVFNVVIILSQ